MSSSEETILQTSIEEKYVPALAQSYRDRFRGLVTGLLGSEPLLIILALVLSSSANSTRSSWYSISLKEMKQKFENMGLSLTTKLLISDLSANSLAMYTGIGYTSQLTLKPIIHQLIQNDTQLQELLENPTIVNSVQFISMAIISVLVIPRMKEILSNNEESAIQFDFNDATLAGLSESQQQYFEISTNALHKAIQSIEEGKPLVWANRSIFHGLNSTLDFLEDLNLTEEQSSALMDQKKIISDVMEENYSTDANTQKEFDITCSNFFAFLSKFFPNKYGQALGEKSVLLKKENLTQEVADCMIADSMRIIFKGLNEKQEKIIEPDNSN